MNDKTKERNDGRRLDKTTHPVHLVPDVVSLLVRLHRMSRIELVLCMGHVDCVKEVLVLRKERAERKRERQMMVVEEDRGMQSELAEPFFRHCGD